MVDSHKLRGVVPAIGTPLTSEERVDSVGLRRLTRYITDASVHGILANGSMAGFACLDEAEQLRGIETVLAEVNGKIPVLGGLGETGTVRAVRMAKAIERQGVAYLSVLPPFYYLATQEHIMEFYQEVAAAVSIPIFLYDNPVLTKNKIKPETVAALRRRIPGLIGMKESDQDALNLQQVVHLLGNDPGFAILTGSEFLFHMALRMGCSGGVGGLYNICPRTAVEMYGAFVAGNHELAAQLQRRLIATWDLFRYGNIWGGFDEALRHMGICERATPAPYRVELSEQDRAAVRLIVDEFVGVHASSHAR